MTQQHDAPVVITTARGGLSADIHSREVKYLVSMAVRTACFIGAVVASGPLRWVLVAAAFFLPYFAVVIANAADGRGSGGPASFEPAGLETLPGSPQQLLGRRDEPRDERPVT